MVLRQKFQHFAFCLFFHVFALLSILAATWFFALQPYLPVIGVVAFMVSGILLTLCLFAEGFVATFIAGLAVAYAHASTEQAPWLVLLTSIWFFFMTYVLRQQVEKPIRGWRLWRVPLTASVALGTVFFLWRSILTA